MHANAILTPRHRSEVAQLLVDDGWPISEVAARFQVSWPTVSSRPCHFNRLTRVDRATSMTTPEQALRPVDRHGLRPRRHRRLLLPRLRRDSQWRNRNHRHRGPGGVGE